MGNNEEVTGGRMAAAGTWRRENRVVAMGNGDRLRSHIFSLYRRMNCRLQRISVTYAIQLLIYIPVIPFSGETHITLYAR